MEDNWLKEVATDVMRKFASWPKWKQDAHRAEMRRGFVYGNCDRTGSVVRRYRRGYRGGVI